MTMRILSLRPAGATLVLAAVVLAAPSAHADATADRVARIDALHPRRHDPAAFREIGQLVELGLVQAPNDYATLWRAARHYFWAGDDPDLPKATRSDIGKRGWAIAERAVAANPNGVEGHFFAAGNIGNYALNVGITTAISQGLQGKFTGHLGKAQQLVPNFERGAIESAWGRYYAELPWPQFDAKKSEEHYRRAIAIYSNNLRARAWLADLWRKQQKTADAQRLASETLRIPNGPYDLPEDLRAKRLATRILERLGAPVPAAAPAFVPRPASAAAPGGLRPPPAPPPPPPKPPG